VLEGHAFGESSGYDTTTFGDRLGLSGGSAVYLFFALSGYLLFWPFVRRAFADGGRIDLADRSASSSVSDL
jgi:peptidoglycan/LPS O-acetylase OafA/YrhL